ncbi:PRD domain-containing protein [Enterococcus casseliflavus]|uniref:PRD domain-containing protein n=1 Tax=Enterococcus casseliflavus TaxID=37734 RepID=UPI003D0A554F
MIVIKKINNNVAVCRDDNNNELIAFGKGIGFPKLPYKINDMNKITMTFYQLDGYYYKLLTEIPADIIQLSVEIVDNSKKIIRRNLNPNIVFSLADHINFAIIRKEQYKPIKLAFSYDIEQLYPIETNIGRLAITKVYEELGVKLPDAEVTAIAMHFVNGSADEIFHNDMDPTDFLIDQAVSLIERTFTLEIDRESFTYNRFVMHLRYYIRRLQDNEPLVTDDVTLLIQKFKELTPMVYYCANDIGFLINKQLGTSSSQSEIFYLMVYIKRIVSNSKTEKYKEE